MNGPEHYERGEQLLERAYQEVANASPSAMQTALDMHDRAARLAQAHFTAALVAATVNTAEYVDEKMRRSWNAVTA